MDSNAMILTCVVVGLFIIVAMYVAYRKTKPKDFRDNETSSISNLSAQTDALHSSKPCENMNTSAATQSDLQILSVKCPSCGATVRFDEQHIATFCSSCGSALPDMKNYVLKTADLKIQEQAHQMAIARERHLAAAREAEQKLEIERAKQEIRREKAKSRGTLIKAIPIIMALALALFYFIWIASLTSRLHWH